MTPEELRQKLQEHIGNAPHPDNEWSMDIIMQIVLTYTKDLEEELADFANDVMDQFGYGGKSGGLSTLEWAESIINASELSSKEKENV